MRKHAGAKWKQKWNVVLKISADPAGKFAGCSHFSEKKEFPFLVQARSHRRLKSPDQLHICVNDSGKLAHPLILRQILPLPSRFGHRHVSSVLSTVWDMRRPIFEVLLLLQILPYLGTVPTLWYSKCRLPCNHCFRCCQMPELLQLQRPGLCLQSGLLWGFLSIRWDFFLSSESLHRRHRNLSADGDLNGGRKGQSNLCD